ncbi:MAG: DUF2157 domain-containing protein [Leptolyngbya sp. DLM2.Bin15]|nr:MAG: DUF2157 domain-containing protein [Leptolyngbya sp. DLM2.Bin15]
MMPEKFRQQLRQEAIAWREEGLIPPPLYDQLSDRYQFDQIDSTARNTFVMVLLGLGSVLIALAVITFIAANWQAWSRLSKVLLLVSLFIGINSAGFYLWRGAGQRWQARFGRALLLLGALLIGPSLALFSQMFHQTGSVQVLYLVWGLAVLVMAYSLCLPMLGIVSIILVSMGYFWYYPDPGVHGLWLVWLDYFPLIAIALFFPLARWSRSAWLLRLVVLLTVFALQFKLLQFVNTLNNFNHSWTLLGAIAASCLIPLLLWGSRALAPLFTEEEEVAISSSNLAVVYVSFFSFLFSFNHWWRNPVSLATGTETTSAMVNGLVLVILFSAIALALWWRLGTLNGPVWRITLSDTSFAVVLLVIAGLLWAHWTFGPLWIAGTLIFNILLTLIAIACIQEALSTSNRQGFWWGLLVLVAQIMSRMLEYDTGLLAKSLAFLLCGIGVILAGLWFERYVRTLASSRS